MGIGFDTFKTSQRISPTDQGMKEEALKKWLHTLTEEARARKASEAARRSLSPADVEALARAVFAEVSERALSTDGVILPEDTLLQLIGDLSGLGPLLSLIAEPTVEDIAINLGYIYRFDTAAGWSCVGPAPSGVGDGLRVMIDRAAQRAPTAEHPIADAMLHVVLPTSGGLRRKGVRINYIMPPASPYGDIITLRLSNYRTSEDMASGNLAALCTRRLPPLSRPDFSPRPFPDGDGVFTPQAANYLLSVMVHGGVLVVAGATGSGKTYIAQRILQEMLDFFPPGSIRLFVVEDSNEIVLNGWDGSPESDTRNVLYTVTRPEIRGGPPPVTMYDLIRAALRSRPHGLVIGEARGAEAWELIRAAATGHGHSAFTIHATSAEYVWPRFLQVVQAHPDVSRIHTVQIAEAFAEAVTTIVYVERHPQYGQIAREIVEVSPIVERSAERPSMVPLFRFDTSARRLLPTGNRPSRHGFRAADLNLPDEYFRR